MANYVVIHAKKNKLLAKRERELQFSIEKALPRAKLEKAAENVRAAKLAVFKMKFSRDSLLPASSFEPEGEALEWKEMSVEQILNLYGHVLRQ